MGLKNVFSWLMLKMSNVQLITSQVGRDVLREIERSKSIYILTSFIMDSGVRLLGKSLYEAANRGAEIKILCGDYLFITQPKALQRLVTIHPRIEARLWQSKGKSFHPKAYLFESNEEGVCIIGSSNLSASALMDGVEWNVKVKEGVNDSTLSMATEQFLHLFYHEQTLSVNRETTLLYGEQYEKFHQRTPSLPYSWSEREEQELMLPTTEETSTEAGLVLDDPVSYGEIQPRFAQLEALSALEDTYEEGYSKAMVVMATGLGKTYLAGFYAKKFKKVLFIAHLEEILGQAQTSFKIIMPNRSSGLFYGKEKVQDVDFVFASIYTLSRDKHLHTFRQDEFDLIIVDEFHHAAAATYQKVIHYFKPKFLLGITATPDRMDQKDIYSICEGNVAYQMHLMEAVQREWLSPFYYYGVYDETDYASITWLGTKYDREELLAVQLKEEVAEKIYDAWNQRKQTRTIGFCSSIEQADFLAAYFTKRGDKSIGLHSRTQGMTRGEAIRQLDDQQISVIFTVNLFNEGVDIPSVDTLLFVRPTESVTVFTQQVGRGLRLHSEKKHCTIIDLIGNYRHADTKLQLFDTGSTEKNGKPSFLPTLPESCELHLDTQVINLFTEFQKKRQPRKEKLHLAFLNLKRDLGRRPSYWELHLNGAEPTQAYYQEFKSYIGFLSCANELTVEEEETFGKHKSLIEEVERTSMTKSYKMVVLQYMLTKGAREWYKPISSADAASFFHHYLTEKDYRKKIDFSDRSSKKLWEFDENKVAKLIATMPMTKWSGSSKGMITFEDELFTFHVKVDEQEQVLLYEWIKQIVEYRLNSYFERKGNR